MTKLPEAHYTIRQETKTKTKEQKTNKQQQKQQQKPKTLGSLKDVPIFWNPISLY